MSAASSIGGSGRRPRRVRHATSTNHDLRVGDADHLPTDIGTFDKIFSCNVWLFWKNPTNVFVALREHLAPGGTLAVTHLPRHGDATRESTLQAATAITTQLRHAGFTEIRQEILELQLLPAVCALTTKPEAQPDTSLPRMHRARRAQSRRSRNCLVWRSLQREAWRGRRGRVPSRRSPMRATVAAVRPSVMWATPGSLRSSLRVAT